MFDNIIKFFRKLVKKEQQEATKSKDTAKERLHLVLMQDRANMSADFLELMKQEIIEVIKKYIDIDENAIDVRLTNKPNEDGTVGSPTLYANIPIISVKNDVKTTPKKEEATENKKEENKNAEEKTEENAGAEDNVGAPFEGILLENDTTVPSPEQSVIKNEEEINQPDENIEEPVKVESEETIKEVKTSEEA